MKDERKFHPKEHEEQRTLIAWMNLIPEIRDIYIHIPNEGARTPRFGRNLKRMGMRGGVFDLFIPLPRSPFHGLWIELKRKKFYHITLAQRTWQEKMRAQGYIAEFAFGWEHGKEIIENYLKSTLEQKDLGR